MQANASAVSKVLPIAKISIRNTGAFSTRAEARGKSSRGRQPPMRCRNHKSDGDFGLWTLDFEFWTFGVGP